MWLHILGRAQLLYRHLNNSFNSRFLPSVYMGVIVLVLCAKPNIIVHFENSFYYIIAISGLYCKQIPISRLDSWRSKTLTLAAIKITNI